MDSTLSSGDYLKYVTKNGRIKIVWGNEKFRRMLNNDFDCDGASAWVPYMSWATTEYMGLHYGCGSPCWGTIILPLNSTDSVVTREFDFGVDAANNQLLYLDGNGLVVENWKTGKKFLTTIKVTCESAFQGYCIDSVNLRNNKLYVKWKEIIGDNDNGREVIETVKVKF